MSNEDRLITEDDTRELFGGDGGGGVFTPLPSNRELSDYSGSHASLSPLPPFPNAPSYEPVPEPSVFEKSGFGTKAGTMPLPAKSQASLLVKRYKAAQPGVERDMIRRQAGDAFGRLDTQGKLDFNSRLNAEARIHELNREMEALRSQIAANEEKGARAEASGAAARYDAALESGSKPGGGAMPRRYFKPGLGYVTELGSRMPDSERANLTALAMLARQRANGDKGGHVVVIGPHGAYNDPGRGRKGRDMRAIVMGRWGDLSSNQAIAEDVRAGNQKLAADLERARRSEARALNGRNSAEATLLAVPDGSMPSDEQVLGARNAVEAYRRSVEARERAERALDTGRRRIAGYDPVTGEARVQARGEWEAERAARADAEQRQRQEDFRRRVLAEIDRPSRANPELDPKLRAQIAVEEDRRRQALLGMLVDGGTPGGGALEDSSPTQGVGVAGDEASGAAPRPSIDDLLASIRQRAADTPQTPPSPSSSGGGVVAQNAPPSEDGGAFGGDLLSSSVPLTEGQRLTGWRNRVKALNPQFFDAHVNLVTNAVNDGDGIYYDYQTGRFVPVSYTYAFDIEPTPVVSIHQMDKVKNLSPQLQMQADMLRQMEEIYKQWGWNNANMPEGYGSRASRGPLAPLSNAAPADPAALAAIAAR